MIADYRVGTPLAGPEALPLDGDDEEPGLPAEAVDVPSYGSSDAGYEIRHRVVPASFHGQRIDKLLVEMAPEFSRNHLQGLVGQGHVKVDEAIEDSVSRKVRAGQRIELALVPTEESRAFRAEPLPLRIVHEDDDLLVIDKAAGMVVHPAAGNWSGTLLNGLLAHHAGAAALPRAGIVHRLDKDTSGLLVVGKTLAAVTALSRAIAARVVRREYLALVHGVVPVGQWRIDAPIARDPKSRIRMAVVSSGRQAQTDVTRLASDGVCSAVRCTLHTGRTHQIRVHLASRGYPLVADALYGGTARWGLHRQALHAARLGFVHPTGGREMSFEAPLAEDLAGPWRALLAAATDV